MIIKNENIKDVYIGEYYSDEDGNIWKIIRVTESEITMSSNIDKEFYTDSIIRKMNSDYFNYKFLDKGMCIPFREGDKIKLEDDYMGIPKGTEVEICDMIPECDELYTWHKGDMFCIPFYYPILIHYFDEDYQEYLKENY